MVEFSKLRLREVASIVYLKLKISKGLSITTSLFCFNKISCHFREGGNLKEFENLNMKYPEGTYFYIYIITNKKNGVLYIGMTGDVKNRMYQHKNKSSKGFSSRYNLNILVYYEKFHFPNPAIRREKQIKKWNRQWKINLMI